VKFAINDSIQCFGANNFSFTNLTSVANASITGTVGILEMVIHPHEPMLDKPMTIRVNSKLFYTLKVI